jgi:phage tail sheath gpL-like
MPTINVPGVPASRKTPGVYGAVILGGAATSAADAPRKIVIIANKITSALTGSAPSFSVAAGTLALATPTQVFSPDDASAFAGLGSQAHAGAIDAFDQYPDADISLCLVAESGGARASAVLTFATTATGAFTVRLRLDGKVLDVPVASGDTATVIATAVATAVLAQPTLPCTAQFLVGAATLSAKHPGPEGNALILQASFVNAAGVETNITTASTSSGAATTCTISGVTTVESTYQFSGGTTACDVTNALAALTTATYHRYVSAFADATNLDLIVAQTSSEAQPTIQHREQAVACTHAASGTAITLATGRNASRLQLAWHYNSPVAPVRVAAQVAAARLNGDVAANDTPLEGENVRPNANLDGCVLASIPPQLYAVERPNPTEVEAALNNGLTPLVPANAGRTAIVRSITTRSLANGQPDYAVIDTATPTTLDAAADEIRADLAATFRGKNIAADPPGGGPALAANVVTPRQIRNRIFLRLKLLERAGWIQNVDAHDRLLVVALSATPGRADADIPVQVADGLHIIAFNIRQTAA